MRIDIINQLAKKGSYFTFEEAKKLMNNNITENYQENRVDICNLICQKMAQIYLLRYEIIDLALRILSREQSLKIWLI